MRRIFFRTLLTLAAAAVPNLAHAQFGNIGSYSPPQVNPYPVYSPYLNMNRPGSAATNYYGIVRPQMNAARNFQQINQALTYGTGAGVGADGYVDPSGQAV